MAYTEKMQLNEDCASSEKNYFDILNTDDILHIISFLNLDERFSLMEVSKEFCELVKLSWSSLKYFSNERERNQEETACKLEKALPSCGQYLKTIEILDANTRNLFALNKYCRNLRCIKISACCRFDIFDSAWVSGFKCLIKNNKKIDCLVMDAPQDLECLTVVSELEFLKSLHVTCSLISYNEDEESRRPLYSLNKLKNLRYFRLDLSIIKLDEKITHLIVNLQNLTEVCLSGLFYELDTLNSFEKLIAQCKNLQSLEAIDMNFMFESVHLPAITEYSHSKLKKPLNYVYKWQKE